MRVTRRHLRRLIEAYLSDPESGALYDAPAERTRAVGAAKAHPEHGSKLGAMVDPRSVHGWPTHHPYHPLDYTDDDPDTIVQGADLYSQLVDPSDEIGAAAIVAGARQPGEEFDSFTRAVDPLDQLPTIPKDSAELADLRRKQKDIRRKIMRRMEKTGKLSNKEYGKLLKRYKRINQVITRLTNPRYARLKD